MSETTTVPETVTLDLSGPAGFPLRLELPNDISELNLVAPTGVEVADMPILSGSLRGMVRDEQALSDAETLGAVFMLTGDAEPVAALKANGLEVGITVLLPGALGGEWNRTPGYAVPENPILLEVWHGSGLLYLQNPVGPDLTETVYVPLAPGTVAVAPPGRAYQVSNTGTEPLVFAEFDSDASQAASDPLEHLKGLAHFILKPESGAAGDFDLEINVAYPTVPTPHAAPPQDLPALGLTQGQPFLLALPTNPATYKWLTEPSGQAEALASAYASGEGRHG